MPIIASAYRGPLVIIGLGGGFSIVGAVPVAITFSIGIKTSATIIGMGFVGFGFLLIIPGLFWCLMVRAHSFKFWRRRAKQRRHIKEEEEEDQEALSSKPLNTELDTKPRRWPPAGMSHPPLIVTTHSSENLTGNRYENPAGQYDDDDITCPAHDVIINQYQSSISHETDSSQPVVAELLQSHETHTDNTIDKSPAVASISSSTVTVTTNVEVNKCNCDIVISDHDFDQNHFISDTEGREWASSPTDNPAPEGQHIDNTAPAGPGIPAVLIFEAEDDNPPDI